MYSFPSLEPVHCSMSSSTCCFLTCLQVSQEAGKVVWCSRLFKNFLKFVVIHTVKGFSIVNEIDVFSGILLLLLWSDGCWQFDLWFFCLSKSSLNIWKFSVHVLLKTSLENSEHCFSIVWDEPNCAVFWTFFGLPFVNRRIIILHRVPLKTVRIWKGGVRYYFCCIYPPRGMPGEKKCSVRIS